MPKQPSPESLLITARRVIDLGILAADLERRTQRLQRIVDFRVTELQHALADMTRRALAAEALLKKQ